MTMNSGSIPGGNIPMPQTLPPGVTPQPPQTPGTPPQLKGDPKYDNDAANKQLAALLSRAGLERLPDGSVLVRDTAAVGDVKNLGVKDATDKLTGQTGARIEPPSPPKVKL